MKILVMILGLAALGAYDLAANQRGQAAATALKVDALGIKVRMPSLRIQDAKIGDEGYACFVSEIAGRLYVQRIDDLKPKPGSCRIHIRRVHAGVLMERNSHVVALHRQGYEANIDWYLPVVGILKSN
jgi:hypothetical protein